MIGEQRGRDKSRNRRRGLIGMDDGWELTVAGAEGARRAMGIMVGQL